MKNQILMLKNGWDQSAILMNTWLLVYSPKHQVITYVFILIYIYIYIYIYALLFIIEHIRYDPEVSLNN